MAALTWVSAPPAFPARGRGLAGGLRPLLSDPGAWEHLSSMLWGARGHQEPPEAAKCSEPLRAFEAQAAASVPAAVHSRS